MSNYLSKSQLTKLKEAAGQAYLAAIQVEQHTGDPDGVDKLVSYFSDGATPFLDTIDALIDKADQP
jgi:hypothetical protein